MAFAKSLFRSRQDAGPDEESELINAIRSSPDEKTALRRVERIVRTALTLDIDYADINPMSDETETALYVCIRRGFLQCANELLQHGARIDGTCTEHEWTPLFVAVEMGDLEATKFLLDNGAQINFLDKANWTSLFVAANEGNSEVLSVLLDRGANCLLENDEGRTAFDYSKNPQIQRIFEKHIESSRGKDNVIKHLEAEIKQLKQIVNEQQRMIEMLQKKAGRKRQKVMSEIPQRFVQRRSYEMFRGYMQETYGEALEAIAEETGEGEVDDDLEEMDRG